MLPRRRGIGRQRTMNCASACWRCGKVASRATVAPACGSESLSVRIGSAAKRGGGNTPKFSFTKGKRHERPRAGVELHTLPPLPTELGFTRVRHLKLAEVG